MDLDPARRLRRSRTAIRDMVGRLLESSSRGHPRTGRVVLEVHGLGVEGVFSGVSFTVRAGEVVGFAGLVGARRTDVWLAAARHPPATRARTCSTGGGQDGSPQGRSASRHRIHDRGSPRPRADLPPVDRGQHLAADAVAVPRPEASSSGAPRRHRIAFKDRLKIRPRLRSRPPSRRCRAGTSRRSSSASGWTQGLEC